MIYNISAMVVYDDTIEAIDEEEAINKFCANCPYDIEADTIEIEEDFDSWWEKLDDIERCEWMKADYRTESEDE